MQDDYHITREAVKSHLAEFLLDNVEGAERRPSEVLVRCLNPNHHDKNPSMYVGDNVNHIAHCRSCGASYNIFHVNNLVNGAPMHGRHFVEKNLNALAVQYGEEPLDLANLTEDQIHKYKCYDIHETAFEILKQPIKVDADGNEDPSSITTRKYSSALGVSVEIQEEIGMATVKNYEKFILELQKIGKWSREELATTGIAANLFAPHMITYTIHDTYGRPVAFAARDLMYDGRFGHSEEPIINVGTPMERKRPKWRNSDTSVIYQKSDTLFGYHLLKKYYKDNKVYIVEGYTDAAVMWSFGIRNTVCIGSVGIVPKHIQMLKDADKQILIMALDNDDAGLNAMDNILETGFSSIPHVTPLVLITPETVREDGKLDCDPDTYLKKYGRDQFMNLQTKTAFQYKLSRLPELKDDGEKSDFVDRFLPLIMNEPNELTQGVMRATLAEKVGVSEVLIRDSQKNLQKRHDMDVRMRLKKELRKVNAQMNDALDLDPLKAEPTIAAFSEKVKKELSANVYAQMTSAEVSDGLDVWANDLEDESKEDCWKTGWPWWDQTFYGIPKKNKLISFPAEAHHGKSVLLMNLALGLLMNNDDPKMLMAYWTIDDDRTELFKKFVAIMSEKKISQVAKLKAQSEDDQKEIKTSIRQLKKWVVDRKLIMKDMAIGTSTKALKDWVEFLVDRYPDKDICVVIDNLADMEGIGFDANARQEYILSEVSKIKKGHTVISSQELRKQDNDKSSGIGALKGSTKAVYKTDLLIFLKNYNVLMKQDSTNGESYSGTYSWVDAKGNRKPILEGNIKKAKIDQEGEGFMGNIYFQMDDKIGKVVCIGPEDKLNLFHQENKKGKHTSVINSSWDSGTVYKANTPPPIATGPKQANRFSTDVDKKEDNTPLTISNTEQDTVATPNDEVTRNLLGAKLGKF